MLSQIFRDVCRDLNKILYILTDQYRLRTHLSHTILNQLLHILKCICLCKSYQTLFIEPSEPESRIASLNDSTSATSTSSKIFLKVIDGNLEQRQVQLDLTCIVEYMTFVVCLNHVKKLKLILVLLLFEKWW